MLSGLLAVNFEYREEGLADGIALTDQMNIRSCEAEFDTNNIRTYARWRECQERLSDQDFASR
jgi:hypothetical protein